MKRRDSMETQTVASGDDQSVVTRDRTELTSDSGRAPRQGKLRHVRRSDRVNLVVPIEIFGVDRNGRLFSEIGRTLLVSRYGASIVSSQALTIDQELTVRSVTSKKEAVARVLGPIGGQEHELIYGVVLLDTNANPWGIEFPALSGAEDTLARTVLQCGQCACNEVVHLNEIELHVFEANQGIPRFCKGCSGTTSWKQAELSANQPVSPGSSAAEPPNGKKKRKYERVQTKVSACVRQPGFADEMVQCENYSRGGFCFLTPTHYREGSRIEVALPYSATGNGNIFVSARIVHVQRLGTKFKVGSSYTRTYK